MSAPSTFLNQFGLDQEPFSNAPVSRFYFDSTEHNEALAKLKHAVFHMKGLILLVGDIGAGKTTLARRLLDALDESEYEAALLVIIHRDVTADWLLRRIALQLGLQNPPQDKLQLLSELYRKLLELHERGKKAVVLIDEAQMLATRELMEEFRGLLNLEVPERKLLTFVFFGLPEIDENLKMDPPLAQRLALRIVLKPLDLPSAEAYIRHRLRLAGARYNIFDKNAVELIHAASGGTPRMINTICDNALLEAAENNTPKSQRPTITKLIIEHVLTQLRLPNTRKQQTELYASKPMVAPTWFNTQNPQKPVRAKESSPSANDALSEIDDLIQNLLNRSRSGQ